MSLLEAAAEKPRLTRDRGLVPGLRPPLVEERARAGILGQDELDVAGVPLEKGGFAVGQVEIPHPDETVAESERPDAIHLAVKALAPGLQRARVVRADVFRVVERHRRDASHRLQDLAD